MSNLSRSFHFFSSIVAAGADDKAAGVSYGGDYYPPSEAGKNANWQGNFFINEKDYRDPAGVLIETKNPIIRITAWNGKNSLPGKGMADILAKAISKGIAISCMCSLRQYPGEVWDNGGIVGAPRTRMLRPNGTPVVDEMKMSFQLMSNSLVIGQEASGLVQEEILNGLRPANWFNRSHADHAAWLEGCKLKNAALFTVGLTKFGHARVRGAGVATGTAATGAYGANPANVAAAVGPVLVEGHPIEKYRGIGLTDDVMLVTPRFTAFHPQILAARATLVTTAIDPNTVSPTDTVAFNPETVMV